jgi:hypothetical protein
METMQVENAESVPVLYPVKIPPTIYQMPTCPLCDADCDTDGASLTCESCGVYWPGGLDGAGRRVEEPDAPACGAEHQPWKGYAAIGNHRYRCVLDADHESDHRGVRCDRPDSEDVHVWPAVES